VEISRPITDGTRTEFYDVFYSNANGGVDIDGRFITIDGDYPGPGAGLNVGDVELLYGADPSQFATSIASFAASRQNYLPGNLSTILDRNINTATGMGSITEGRMRIPVGFEPEQWNGLPARSSFLLGALDTSPPVLAP